MRSALTAAALATSTAPMAEAQSRTVFGETRVSTSLHDRGEQLSAETLELMLGVEQSTSLGTAYATVYRIEPIGPSRQAFSSETDYSIGLIVEAERFSADVSANYLTYPGSDDEPSLELAASIDVDLIFDPNISLFHDAHTSDSGVQVSAGPSRQLGGWDASARVLAGLVSLGDGSPNRTYGGVQVSGTRQLTRNLALGMHASIDTADRNTLSADVRRGHIQSMKRHGLSAGISLSYVN